jgi:hypothetical protein
MFSEREKTSARYTYGARYAIKIEKIPKYGPGHSQSYDSMYFQVRGIY